MTSRILITVFFYAITASNVSAQIFKLPDADSLSGNYFGVSVAVDGNLAVVGATGVRSCGVNSGAAFVYERGTDQTWTLQQTLIPRDCREDHFFGKAVSISDSTIVVTSYRTFVKKSVSNGVYIFEKRSGEWEQVQRISDPKEGQTGPFASCVAVDGNRLLVTSLGDSSEDIHGSGFIFYRNRVNYWDRESEIQYDGSTKNGLYGSSCDLDGDRLVISASSYSPDKPGSISVYHRNDQSTNWNRVFETDGIRDFFMPVDLEGDLLVVGESKAGRSQSGRVRIFGFNGNKWKQEATLRPSVPYEFGAFGSGVAISNKRILVVGFDEQLDLNINVDRVVYVFERPDKDWTQKQILDVGNTAFGSSIALNNNIALIGQSSNNEPGQGFIILFNRP